MRARRLVLFFSFAGFVALAACRKPDIGVRLRFPSEESFLASVVATVDVYDGSGDGDTSPDSICRALSASSAVPPSGVKALASSGKKDVCDFRDGKTVLGELSVGRHVLFAEVEDQGATAILRGCDVVDITGSDEGELSGDEKKDADELGVSAFIEVQLATLPGYPDEVDLSCADAAEKCDDGISCFE